MRTRLILITALAAGSLAAAALAQAACSHSRGPRAIEVTEIVADVIATHPDGTRLASDAEFVGFAASLKSDADEIGLSEYVVRLHRLFSLVRDGHTAVLSFALPDEPFSLRLPILVQPFADGLYVIEARDEALPLLGGRIVSVNGAPIDEVVRAYVAGAPGDNRAFALRWSPFLFAFPGWLHGHGFAGGPVETPIAIEVALQTGQRLRADLLPRVGANLERKPLARALSSVEVMAWSEDSGNFTRVLADGKALYLSLDSMSDTDAKSFDEFTREVRVALAGPDLTRVVIDLRRNGGGNNLLPESLRRTLVKSRFNRPGGLYVLTGPRTFSAAMNFATRLERETDAFFVGEPTGGRPNHFGDAVVRIGSATGVQYLVSTLRWQDSAPFDERIWILPDLSVPGTFSDYLSGTDRALESALYHRTADATGDDALRATPWERASQNAGWRFFFEKDGED